MITFVGCHGTSLQAGEKIIQSKFIISKKIDEWLGDGTYFFVNGINNNIEELASKWASCQSWDNKTKSRTYTNFCVIESDLEVDDDTHLDLTSNEGVEILNYIIGKFLDKIKHLNKTLTFLDGAIINLARNEKILKIDVVKGNFFIKFEQERVYRINLRTNNCTICSVFDVDNVVKSKKIIKISEII